MITFLGESYNLLKLYTGLACAIGLLCHLCLYISQEIKLNGEDEDDELF